MFIDESRLGFLPQLRLALVIAAFYRMPLSPHLALASLSVGVLFVFVSHSSSQSFYYLKVFQLHEKHFAVNSTLLGVESEIIGASCIKVKTIVFY